MSKAQLALLTTLLLNITACTRTATTQPQGAALITRTPTASPAPTFTPAPTAEVDECLFGTWQVDSETLSAYLMSFIAADIPSEFEILEVKGLLQFTFNQDFSTTLSSQGFSLELYVETEDSNFTSTALQLSIKAKGSSSYAVHKGKLITYSQDYSLDEDIDIPVHISETSVSISPISITPYYFISMPWSDDPNSEFNNDGETPRYANYHCDAQALSLSQDATPLIIFFRVEEPVD